MITCSLPGRCHTLVLVALLTGCATSPPAPVEDRAPGLPTKAQAPLLSRPAASAGAQTFPAPDSAQPVITAPADEGRIAVAPDPTTEWQRPTPGPAPRREPEAVNPAVVALLNRANQDAGAGSHDTAAASLERAIRIEPGNPWLWHRLATTRLAQGRPGEAAALAAKSTALAVGDPALQAENWLVIARVHRERGEAVAARAAEQRARELGAKPS